MPRLSDSMEEGTIVRWIVADGAVVRVGDELVEIETDKATMTYEADAAGVVHILASAGERWPSAPRSPRSAIRPQGQPCPCPPPTARHG
jgi:hypothetical protein